MVLLSAVISTFLFLWLLFAEPFIGVHDYHVLAKLLPEIPHVRASLYLTWLRNKFVYLGLVAVAVLPVASLGDLGLRLPRRGSGGLLLGVLLAVAVVAGVSVLTAIGQARFRFHATKGLERRRRLVPSTHIERFDWVLLSVVSGIVQEILYRGFGLLYLQRFIGTGVGTAALVTSVAFGLAHAYQGWRGVLAMTFLGLGLAFLFLATGSLLPAIAMHVLVDLRVLLIFRRRENVILT